MSKIKPQYLVSTDSIGLFGGFEQFLYLWQEYFDDKTIDGVEAIAFKPVMRLNKLIKILNSRHIPVLSIHGKTGGEYQLNFLSRIIMTFVNYGIVGVKNILKKFPEVEFLSHGPYLAKKSTQQVIFQMRPKKIWIENHLYGKQGVNEAIEQIIVYRKNNIDASGMLDIYHYIAQLNKKPVFEDWPKLIGEINSFFLLKDHQGKKFFNGIHFPIGSRVDDSLPINDMSDQTLQLFGQKIIPNVERVVFENQQTFPGLFFSSKKMLVKQKIRNKKIIERLKTTGILL